MCWKLKYVSPIEILSYLTLFLFFIFRLILLLLEKQSYRQRQIYLQAFSLVVPYPSEEIFWV